MHPGHTNVHYVSLLYLVPHVSEAKPNDNKVSECLTRQNIDSPCSKSRDECVCFDACVRVFLSQ